MFKTEHLSCIKPYIGYVLLAYCLQFSITKLECTVSDCRLSHSTNLLQNRDTATNYFMDSIRSSQASVHYGMLKTTFPYWPLLRRLSDPAVVRGSSHICVGYSCISGERKMSKFTHWKSHRIPFSRLPPWNMSLSITSEWHRTLSFGP